ncbi:MAG TPA: hypothetical protein VL907_13280 [Pyrinomonadaceae bacterium]|nr:hypothetical protein [Pyrinomonadaceae bacterium]
MTLISRSLIRKIVLLLAPLAAVFMTSSVQHGVAQKKQDDTRTIVTWEHNDDHVKRRLEIRGTVEFNDEYTDVKDVSEGGIVRIEEVLNGQSRRYEVRRDVGGQLSRAFYLNGQQRELDAAARTWVAQLVLNAVRQGGIDADKRVQRILSRSGVAGVLREIELIESDYAERRYYDALVKLGNLNATQLEQTLAHAAQHLKSDYEQSQFLIAVAPAIDGKAAAVPAFFNAVDTVKSNYERSRVLKTLLARVAPSKEILVLIATSTRGINSDYEKASVLKDVAAVYLDDPALSGVFFQTVSTIDSDYEHRRVLSALLKTKNLSEGALKQLLDSAAAISSDYEKATLLLEASRTYTGDARLRDAFLKAADSIKSEYERGRVLSALLKNKQIG